MANLIKRHMYQKWLLTVGQPLYCRGTWLSSNVTINLSACQYWPDTSKLRISGISTTENALQPWTVNDMLELSKVDYARYGQSRRLQKALGLSRGLGKEVQIDATGSGYKHIVCLTYIQIGRLRIS